jgi:plastocyanin
MRRRHLLVILALLSGAPAAGCDDDRPPARARDRRVHVVLDDYSITPQRIEARPGRLTFTVDNAGRIAHNLVVLRPSGGEVKPRLPSLRPGDQGRFTVRLRRRGRYDLICSLGNHRELGMSGILTVE